MRTRVLVPTLLIVTLGVGLTAGFLLPRDDTFFAIRKNFQIFGALYEELVGSYVDPVDAERFMRTGIEAMLRDLDPYTNFFDEAVSADIDIRSRGRFAGVGLNIGLRGERVTVLSPVEGTSGYKQGVRAGDILLDVAGQPVEGLTLADVENLLRGEPGSVVEVVVEREGAPEPIPFLLTREQARVTNVSYTGFVDDDTSAGLGYIRLERFGRDAAKEAQAALQSLMEPGTLRGLVLDLRDNPGGLLEDAVAIVQLFVPQNSVIVSTRGREASSERVYRSRAAPVAPELPLAVLVNGLSASASEIVAGALQDHDRAVVLGETSFGKGLVQIVRPLPHNTSLKLTTAKYYIPSGRSIQAIEYAKNDGSYAPVPDSLRRTFTTEAGRPVKDGRGIEPDVVVALDDESAIEAALRRRAAFFFFANQYAAAHPLPDAGAYADPDDLDLDMNALYREFQDWLDTQDFSYRTDAERAVETLREELAAQGYIEAQDEAATLAEAIRREKAEDFQRHAARLRDLLRTEVMARYLGERAQIEAALVYDPQMREALALLTDADRYRAVLTP